MTPPLLARVAKAAARRSAPREWEYRGTRWPTEGSMRGWNVESVVARQRADWNDLAQVMHSTRSVAGDVVAHNTRMCFGYVLGLASSGKSGLSILDWGGGLGQYGLMARALYPHLTIDYHCRDLPLMTDAGRQLLPDATFYDADDEAFAQRYDLVMASSSLQYVEDWRSILARLAESTRRHLFVTRQPLVDSASAFVMVQRPIVHGYDTEYPGWALNRGEFLSAVTGHGLGLKREFLTGGQPVVPGAPEQPVDRGFLFERLAE